MDGKGVVLANGGSSTLFRHVLSRPRLVDGNLLSARRFIKLHDSASCMVFLLKSWGSTGYGAKSTKVIHRWNIKPVLKRAGVL